jgi:arylsulfatase A-like enzyme
VAVVWGFEVVLLRTSSGPQTPIDLVESLLLLGLTALGPAAVLDRLRLSANSKRRWTAPVVSVPAVLVALGIALPAAQSRGEFAIVAAVGILLSGAALVCAHAWRTPRPAPSPLALVALLSLSAVGAWFLEGGGFPPGKTLLTAGVLGLATGVLARRSRTLPAVVVLVALVGSWPQSPPDVSWRVAGPIPSGPDLVLISVDTLRADVAREMSSYRELARRGVAFSEVQAEAPWTLPSMATLHTGLPVAAHGAGRVEGRSYTPIAAEIPTLASRLEARGYDTSAVVSGNPFVSRAFGFDRGFAVFDFARGLPAFALPKPVYPRAMARPLAVRVLMSLGVEGPRAVGGADTLATRAIHILERRRDRPLLLWVHFFDAHLPYFNAREMELPRRWTRMLEAGAARRQIRRSLEEWGGEEGRAALWAAYRNEVAHIDRAILRLLSRLQADGGRERLVLFTSDHGEEFFDHGGFEHGHQLYQEVISVPLVIARSGGGSRAPRGTVTRQVVGHLDVVATVLAAAGAADPSLPGQDLLSDVAVVPYRTGNLLYGREPDDRISVREGRWKAIVGSGGPAELFDLDSDPRETRDLSHDRPGIVQRLGTHATADAPAGSAPAELDAPLRESLRALGYLVDER